MIEFTSANIRMWSILGSAGTFGLAALELPEIDEQALVVTSDLRNFPALIGSALCSPTGWST